VRRVDNKLPKAKLDSCILRNKGIFAHDFVLDVVILIRFISICPPSSVGFFRCVMYLLRAPDPMEHALKCDERFLDTTLCIKRV